MWATVAKVGAPLLAGAALVGVVVVDDGGTAGGGGTAGAALVATAPDPATWIDAPLPGTTVDPGPLAVTLHAAHPDGVDELAVWVDDGEPATTGAGGGTLEHATVEIDLDEPGWHLVSAVGRTADGTATPTATVGVTVTGAVAPPPSTTTSTAPPDEVAAPPEPTTTAPEPGPSTTAPSPQPTAPGPTTPGPTAPGPTTGPTTCTGFVAPNPTAPPDGFASSDGDVELQWSYAGCNPPTFRVEWSLDPAFPPLETDSATVAGTARSAVAVVPCGPGSWRWRVRAELSGITVVAGPWSAVRRFSYPARIC